MGIHRFLCSYNREGAYESIGHFDPIGRYVDGEADPCQDCDEHGSPYCVNRCDHNDACYGCADCYDYRTEFCYQECEYNSGFELVHPCDGCDQVSTDYCFLECPYNEDWQLQNRSDRRERRGRRPNPCDNCQHSTCTPGCSYYEKRQAAEVK